MYVALCYCKLDYYDVSLEILQVYLNAFADSALAVNLKVRDEGKGKGAGDTVGQTNGPIRSGGRVSSLEHTQASHGLTGRGGSPREEGVAEYAQLYN